MTFIIKLIIIAFLGAIFFSLGSALYYLLQGKSHSTQVIKALTWRIALSLFLFALLLIAFTFGFITPHSIY